jgi:hypothetical protein
MHNYKRKPFHELFFLSISSSSSINLIQLRQLTTTFITIHNSPPFSYNETYFKMYRFFPFAIALLSNFASAVPAPQDFPNTRRDFVSGVAKDLNAGGIQNLTFYGTWWGASSTAPILRVCAFYWALHPQQIT